MSIRDFFKPKGANISAEKLTPVSNALKSPPKKSSLVLDSDDEPRAESSASTIMKRSSSSMVNSKSTSKKASPVKPVGPRGKPVIIEDSDEDDEEIFNSLPDTLEEFVPETENDDIYNDDHDDDEQEVSGKKVVKKRSNVGKKESFSKKAKNDSEASILLNPDSISASLLPSESTPKKKSNYYAFMAKKSAGPVAPGSKEIPVGSPDCLTGLSFVFTGELSSISRDDASDLAKRYGGRVTTAPSGKTDYVVVGENAGASKLEKIEKLHLKTLDEDAYFDLIRSRSKCTQTCQQQENQNLTSPTQPSIQAAELSNKSNAQTTSQAAASPQNQQQVKVQPTNIVPMTAGSELWTVKWAPKTPEELIGNHSIYEKLKSWLDSWRRGVPTEFRAVLLSGPPGIGKTTMAHMACKQAGYDIVELNASDTRSKKSLHEEVREIINNSSLQGFFTPTAKKEAESKLRTQCIIMDECDGMSAGDRGGMAELIQLIKKTKVPIICACNDRASPKVRSLANYCLDLRFRRPDGRQVVPRISEICKKEGLTVSPNTIEELVASTQADIRQIITLLSTYRLTHTNLSYDDSKHLGESNKKDMEEGPFEAIHQLLSGPGYSKMSMNQKLDLYFIDSSLMPLMVQENYLKCRASTPRTVIDPVYGSASANFMTLAWAAADSISKSDAIDSLIRGYNQEWSLAPLHAFHSCVRPAYYCSGNIGGRIDFASWLGQNSKQQKYLRILKELTQHLYLHTHANKLTLCLDYAPTMASIIMSRLQNVETIEKAIEFLDSYAIAKEDVEPLLEIVLDPTCNDQAYAKLPTASKSAFTRKYNQGTHLLPYALGTTVPVRKIKTDVSTAVDEETEADILTDTEEKDGEDENSITKDKMIKAKVSKGASAAGKVKASGASATKRGGKK